MFKELPLPVGRRSAVAAISDVRFTYWRCSSLPGVPASHEAAAISNAVVIFCTRWTELQKTIFHIHDPLEEEEGGKNKKKMEPTVAFKTVAYRKGTATTPSEGNSPPTRGPTDQHGSSDSRSSREVQLGCPRSA